MSDDDPGIMGLPHMKYLHRNRRRAALRGLVVYAVFREGVYRHACCGIFPDEDAARQCADAAAKADIDSHHWYRVYGYPLGEPLSFKSETGNWSPLIVEGDALYETKKSLA